MPKPYKTCFVIHGPQSPTTLYNCHSLNHASRRTRSQHIPRRQVRMGPEAGRQEDQRHHQRCKRTYIHGCRASFTSATANRPRRLPRRISHRSIGFLGRAVSRPRIIDRNGMLLPCCLAGDCDADTTWHRLNVLLDENETVRDVNFG